MAKKNRYSRRAPLKRPLENRQGVNGVAPVTSLAGQSGTAVDVQSPTNQSTGSRKPLDFSQEYQYVVSDLKRVGIIAVALILLLIVLSFVL